LFEDKEYLRGFFVLYAIQADRGSSRIPSLSCRGISVMSARKEEMVERRRHKRFKVRDGAFVVLMPPSTKLGQLIDISSGGLAFRYLSMEERSNNLSELDIFLTDNSFYLEEVPVINVSDFQIAGEFPFSSITTRRHGVQFGELTHNQISRLEYFIRNHTTG
jgi:hypothetical protein